MQDNDYILLEYYDELFPVDRSAVNFIQTLAKRYTPAGPVKVLELGCATGTVLLQLAQQGMDVIGIDSREALIQSANRRNHEPKSSARFFFMPLLECQSYFPPESFHIVICLGDILARIGGREDISRLLRQVCRLLCPKGTVVFQLINYDRIIRERISSLPVIKTGRARLTRQYIPTENGLLLYTSSIYSLAEVLVYSRDEMLYPLTSAVLTDLLEKAGLTPGERFADFDRNPPDSRSLVLAGATRKKTT
jgi:SAM-dependent methyltransferase